MQGVSSVEGTLFSFERKKPPCKFIWEERRMKKFWIVLLSLLLSLACVMGFAACTERPDDETGGTVQPGDPSGPDDPDDPGKPHEHDFGEWTVTVPATCTEAGEEQRTCSCGETETRIVAALGHDYVNGVCTRCEDMITATDDSYFIFTELADGTYSVAWDRNTDLPAEVVIPWEYNGKPVTQVEEEAFDSCDSLKSVTIPSSVTSIGKMAFYDCRSLMSIAIPDGVTSIEESAFYNCYSLTSITIPDGVTSIGESAFYGCASLMSITVSAENPVYHSDGNCLIETASKTLILGSNTSVIPDDGSVTSIGEMAFAGCYSLTSITIPDSVTSIGEKAFSYCESLASVTIGDGVTSIAGGAFAYCDSLTSITIPDSVTSIGSSAFYNCDSLASVTIGDGVTSIAGGAFAYCDSLTSITIPDSVTSIGEYAFCWCPNLTSVTIGDGVTSIGDTAFRDCSSLTSVTIGDGVTSIGEFAFARCDSLTSVTFENPNGWSADGAAISAADLSDPATAAQYLRGTYYRDIWTRA